MKKEVLESWVSSSSQIILIVLIWLQRKKLYKNGCYVIEKRAGRQETGIQVYPADVSSTNVHSWSCLES